MASAAEQLAAIAIRARLDSIARSPRAVSDFTHSSESFLSAGTSFSKSARVNGPAIADSHGRKVSAARPLAPNIRRKSRRGHPLAGAAGDGGTEMSASPLKVLSRFRAGQRLMSCLRFMISASVKP